MQFEDQQETDLSDAVVTNTPRYREIVDRFLAEKRASDTLRAEAEKAQARIADLKRELSRLAGLSVVELAAERPELLDYCRHWEGRAEKAEHELAARGVFRIKTGPLEARHVRNILEQCGFGKRTIKRALKAGVASGLLKETNDG